MFTYVRTEVNYTEEVDDPVDSDGEQSSHHPDFFSFICFYTDF